MRHIAVHKDAAAEADAAASRYEYERAGPGIQFAEELNESFSRLRKGAITAMPWRSPLAKRGVKYILLRRFPFKIVFVDRGNDIAVLAVAHHSRKPAYWRERMR